MARTRPCFTPASSFIRRLYDKKLVVLCLDGRVVDGMTTELCAVGIRPEPSHRFILNYLAAWKRNSDFRLVGKKKLKSFNWKYTHLFYRNTDVQHETAALLATPCRIAFN